MALLNGFHHIALKSSNFEKSVKFYTDLGMEFYTSWGEGSGKIAMFKFGPDSILELFASGTKDAEANARFAHLAICCDDVDAAYNAALAAGAKEKSKPAVVPLNSAPVKLTLNCAFVFGPDGEELEFFKVISAE